MTASAAVHVQQNVLFLQFLKGTANMKSMRILASAAALVQAYVL